MKILDLGTWAGKIIGFIFGYLLFKLTGYTGLLFLLTIYIGIWLSGLYLKKYGSSEKIMKWLSWTNLVVWFLPILGVLVGTFCLTSLKKSEPKNIKTYQFLTILGLILSIGNAILGVLMRL